MTEAYQKIVYWAIAVRRGIVRHFVADASLDGLIFCTCKARKPSRPDGRREAENGQPAVMLTF